MCCYRVKQIITLFQIILNQHFNNAEILVFDLFLLIYSFNNSFLEALQSSRLTNAMASESHCTGSLNIAHEDEFRNINYISLDGRRTKYPNIKRGFPIIRRNTVSHVEIYGNCCWEFYPDRRFRGGKQTIFPGSSIIYPEFQPNSIMKLECH